MPHQTLQREFSSSKRGKRRKFRHLARHNDEETSFQQQGQKSHSRQQRHQNKRQLSNTSNYNLEISNDKIEAQLELQRKQQRENQARQIMEKESAETNKLPENNKVTQQEALDGYRYDPQRNAYFPSSYFDEMESLRTSDEDHDKVPDLMLPARHPSYPFPVLGVDCSLDPAVKGGGCNYLRILDRQVCLDREVRRRLAAFGCSYHQLQRLRLMSSAQAYRRPRHRSKITRSGMEWAMLFGATASEDCVSSSFWNDLTCKIHRPPWLRTFDVWTQPTLSNYTNEEYRTLDWQIATVVEGGYDIRSRWREGRSGNTSRLGAIRTQRESLPSLTTPQTVRYLDFSEERNGVLGRFNLGLLDSSETSCSLELFSVASQNSSNVQARQPAQFRFYFASPANDFVDDGACGFLIAATRGKPWSIPFSSQGQSSPLQIRDLPPSEILCVERILGTAPNIFCFGHRNGIVTLYDQRASRTANVLDRRESSIISLQPTCETGDSYILVRNQSSGGNAFCCLWDIRKMSSSLASPSVGVAPLLEFNLPQQANAILRLTNRCKGMAVDPCGTTLFSPYVEGHDGEGNPCLGAWSMITGEWIGHKKLATPSDYIPSSFAAGVSWVELCPRRTRAWQWPTATESKELEPQLVEDVPSFGLWYKCGQSPISHSFKGVMPPRDAGNIHHIVI